MSLNKRILALFVGAVPTIVCAEPTFRTLATYVTTNGTGTIQDVATTSDPAFAEPGYDHLRNEGSVFSPMLPKPPGTRTLWRWYSPSRGDYFTTSDPAWAEGSPGPHAPDYYFVSTEGFLYLAKGAGTVPLRSYYSPSHEDNFATSNPAVTPFDTIPESDYFAYRTEGYLLRPEAPIFPDTPDAFHWGRFAGGVTKGRKLLLGLIGFTDPGYEFDRSVADMRQRFFGVPTSFPNVRASMQENSHGLFTWTEASTSGSAGIFKFTFPDDPQTSQNESKWRDSFDPLNSRLLFLGLQTSLGYNIGADNGGGGPANAKTKGALEQIGGVFALWDANGGDLISGDVVAFKTVDGHWLQEKSGALWADGVATSGAPPTAFRFTIRRVTGTGSITGPTCSGTGAFCAWNIPCPTGQTCNSVQVSLQAVSNGKYLVADGGGGGALSVNAATPGTNGVFALLKSGLDPSRETRETIRQALASGWDPRPFDANGDKRITDDELLYMYYDASLGCGGGARWLGTFPIPHPSGPLENMVGSTCGLSENPIFNQDAHESSHLLGTIDLYPFWNWNDHVTMMGNDSGAACGDPHTFHLDAWHRMQLGWVAPKLYSIRDPGSRMALYSLDSATGEGGGNAVILYDPARYNLYTKEGEYFLLEYRRNDFASSNYDRDVYGKGLAIWLVKVNSGGDPRGQATVSVCDDGANYGKQCSVTADCPGGNCTTTASINAVNLVGSPGATLGIGGLWTSANGPIYPNWYDGTPAQVAIRVQESTLNPSKICVDWKLGSKPPLVYSIAPKAVPLGEAITIRGDFALSPSGMEVVVTTMGDQPLEVFRQPVQPPSCDDQEVFLYVPIPEGTPSGKYSVHIDDADEGSSNPVDFVVYCHPNCVDDNNNCSAAEIIPGNNAFTDSTANATGDGSASCGASANSPDVWFDFLAPCTGELTWYTDAASYDTVLSVHDGCPGTVANEIGCNDDCPIGTPCQGTHNSYVRLPVIADSSYLVRLSGYNGASGNATIHATCSPAIPENDACAVALPLSEGMRSGTTSAATNDGDSTCGAATGAPDIWYTYTASCTGNLVVSTMGSSVDTVLSVHSACPGNGVELACNDDCDAGSPCAGTQQSYLEVPVVANSSYVIRLSGNGGALGDFNIQARCVTLSPENNLCAQRAAATEGTLAGTLESASNDGQCSCENGNAAPDVWYDFQAACNGNLVLTTAGSSLDTVLSAFDRCPGQLGFDGNVPLEPEENTELGCNDDCPASSPCAGSVQSFLEIPVFVGNHYAVRVSGFQGAVGPFQLTLFTRPTAGDGDFDGSGRVDLKDYAVFQQCMGRSFSGCDACAAGDFSGNGLININDHVFLVGGLSGP